MDNQFDTSGQKTDNVANNENDVVVNMAEMKPINDTSCKHEIDGKTTFVQDSDEIEGQVAWVCTQCDRGTFLPKGVQVT
jgi:hypothetical protein